MYGECILLVMACHCLATMPADFLRLCDDRSFGGVNPTFRSITHICWVMSRKGMLLGFFGRKSSINAQQVSLKKSAGDARMMPF